MTTALYRRYRPETFAEMIAQGQVTEPLRTALRNDRVGHAYLFSGPRGCGKTTSARILARCLNCAQGPTDTPCGECESCVELSRSGSGSLDVVEIDAASHNGVDDARDLRERAVFAPARDRFKIFILDEAHMVTPQGFNALLKLVEEPPEHVKFIFATTEPEKVLGTIRSRTHHYPFRLVPPGPMLEYVSELCTSEGVEADVGVLPLVVRAGGGSPRDTLSLLDQLIAGAEDGAVRYDRAVALLGYTHAELLDEIVSALSHADAAATFAALDRVIQTGQDPRRFVEDLLEHLRDLIIVDAVGASAGAVLRGASAEDLDRMRGQAAGFGSQRLSRVADTVSSSLDDMSGATSPRLQLELMAARILAPSTPDGMAGAGSAAPAERIPSDSGRAAAASADGAVHPPAPRPSQAPLPSAAPVAAPSPASDDRRVEQAPAPRDTAGFEDLWPRILDTLQERSRTSWMVVVNARVVSFAEDVLTLEFSGRHDLERFKQRAAGKGPSEDLRAAISEVCGVTVKYLARLGDHAGTGSAPTAPAGTAMSAPAPAAAVPADPAPTGQATVATPPTPSAGAGAGLPSAPPEQAPGIRPEPRLPDSSAASVTSDPPARSAGGAVDRPAAAPPASEHGPALTAAASPSAASPARPQAAAPSEAAAPPREPEPGPVIDWPTVTVPSDDDAPDWPDEEPSPRFDEPPGLPGASGGPSDVSTEAPGVAAAADRAPAGSSLPAAPEPAEDARPRVQHRAPQLDGDRYGEAVVREILDARFVREEPYTPRTSFS